MAEDYAELKRRLADMQARKGAIQVTQTHNVAPSYSEIQASKPRRILERIGCFTALAVAAAGVCLWFYLQAQETKRKEQAHRAQEEQTRQRISQFAAKYDAVTNWREDLNSKGVPHTVYSAELTPLFVRQDQRPLLFIVSVKDVTLHGSEHVIHSEVRVTLGNKLKLRLRATPDQAKTVMADSGYPVGRYAVVARIGSVVSLNESTENRQDDEERQPLSLAEGECIDVMPLGLYFGDILDLLPKGPT